MDGKISVIVPVYNCEKYLRQCIDSIVNQTYSKLEIILIDDGSIDSSGKICDQYSLSDTRIKVVHQENQGVSAARNAGLEQANGEFITFVDADDNLELDMYELLVGMMQDYDADICHCGYKRVLPNGELEKEVNGTRIILDQNAVDAIVCMLSGQHFAPSLWNKLFRTELFNQIEFDTNLVNNEDVLVAFQVFQKAKKIVFIDETKYCYVVHSESACHFTNAMRKIEDAISATETMVKECQFEELYLLLNDRLIGNYVQAYRLAVFSGNIDLKRAYKNRLVQAMKNCEKIGRRNRLNCLLLLHCPGLYKNVFSLYDKLRKPQWDAK